MQCYAFDADLDNPRVPMNVCPCEGIHKLSIIVVSDRHKEVIDEESQAFVCSCPHTSREPSSCSFASAHTPADQEPV
jgi:hypothetical protein